jgi:GNAT superfamily N-acetyltransferase
VGGRRRSSNRAATVASPQAFPLVGDDDVGSARRRGLTRQRACAGASPDPPSGSWLPTAWTGRCVALAELVADGSNVDWSELFSDNIEHSDRYIVVAKAGDELIGYGRTAWFEPDPVAPPNAAPAGYYRVGLVVDPSWRRRGVASAIISARLGWVAQRASEVWYFADVRNRVSIQLHERAGFETVTDDFWFPTVMDGGGSHLLGRVTLPPGCSGRYCPVGCPSNALGRGPCVSA